MSQLTSHGTRLETAKMKDTDRFLEVICVTFNQVNQLRCLVASLACQTDLGFTLKIIHDGPSSETRECVNELQRMFPNLQIIYQETSLRFNDYGHTLRDIGLSEAVQEYVLLTNGDNYYVPIFIEEIRKSITEENPEIVYFDMVHSHLIKDLPNPIGYQALITEPRINRIDIGSFVFRRVLGQSIGFKERGFAADGIFFEALKATGPKIVKISKVLFVHN